MKPRIDPVTLEVITNALSTIADEMALVILRTSYSITLRDGPDFSTAVCDRQGRFIAQGVTAPIHLGSFPDAMRRIVEEYGPTTRPGDVFISNDPYSSGGMHLPDVFVVKPVFSGERLVGYAATLGHQCDIGGNSPGSMTVYTTEVYQEGLRIPTLKLYEAGVPNRTMFDILEKNVRLPVHVMGDLSAQLAACSTCERGLLQIVEKYGPEEFERYVEALHDHAEFLMREEIAALPDGVYEFEDWIDGLGEKPEPIRFKVTLTISGSDVSIDWTGTSAQVKAAINGPVATTKSMAYVAVRCMARAPIPNCQGFTRPISLIAPPGTIVNPREPAACASRGIIAYRMLDVLFGALAQAAPERIPAACEGGPTAMCFGGRDDAGKPFVMFTCLLGSWGGRNAADGLEGVSNLAGNGTNQPIEVIESTLPIEISCYGYVPNSGGPGRFRGGYAHTRAFRVLTEEMNLDLRSDRRAVLPYGLAGGLPGTPSWNILNPGRDQKLLPTCPMEGVKLKRGDVIQHVQAGGGGHGNPLERDAGKILADVMDELITPQYARDVYGVVIRDGAVDEPETRRLRARMSAEGDSRSAYMKHFYSTIGIERSAAPASHD